MSGDCSGEVQGVRAARRRFRPGTDQMDLQEIDHARVAQVALDDPHHGWFLPITSRRLPASIAPRADDRQGLKRFNICRIL